MITISNLGEHGRLGNQLYQYAALKGIAYKNNLIPKIPNLDNKSWHKQKCLLNEFQIDCETLSPTDTWDRVYYEPNPSGFYYNQFDHVPDNTNLGGYFQNTKYFDCICGTIKKELIPKKRYLDEARTYLQSISQGKKVISIHIRRGDLVDGTNPDIGLYSNNLFDLNSEFGRYLYTSLAYFNSKLDNFKLLIFVGGSRSGDDTQDIAWAKSQFNQDNMVVSDSNNPIIDFSRMILCDHNIISHSSTFGWWAGYVNLNPDKIVIAPINYHLDNTTSLRDGFFPKEWVLI